MCLIFLLNNISLDSDAAALSPISAGLPIESTL